MRKQIFSAAILAVLLPLAACAQFDDAEEEGTDFEWADPQPEQIWVDGEVLIDGVGPGSAASGSGACECTTPECFEAWVVDSFGCDVCVTFVCEEVPVAHSCAPCDGSPLDRGQVWTSEGRLQ